MHALAVRFHPENDNSQVAVMPALSALNNSTGTLTHCLMHKPPNRRPDDHSTSFKKTFKTIIRRHFPSLGQVVGSIFPKHRMTLTCNTNTTSTQTCEPPPPSLRSDHARHAHRFGHKPTVASLILATNMVAAVPSLGSDLLGM